MADPLYTGIPVDITFPEMAASLTALKTAIRVEVQSLERSYGGVVRSSLTVEKPRNRIGGKPYRITISLTLGGREISITHEPRLESILQRLRESEPKEIEALDADSKYLEAAVAEAFDRVRRALEELDGRGPVPDQAY